MRPISQRFDPLAFFLLSSSLAPLHFLCYTLCYYYSSSLQIKATMATDQIRQMVNFILQEAHEKANEIRVKVGSKFVGFVGGTMNGS